MTTASWKVLASHNAFDHRWYVVRRDTVQLPDGTIDDYFVSVRPDVAVIVAVDRSGQVILVRQYQHGIRKVTLEFPAGTFEDEQPEAAALRELEEETGYLPRRIEYLGRCFDNASKNTNTVHMFLALDCEPRGRQRPEPMEKGLPAWKSCSCPLPELPKRSMEVRLPRCPRSRPVIGRCEDSLS